MATHKGAVWPLSLAVLKFIEAEVEIGAPIRIHKNIKVAMHLIRLPSANYPIDLLKVHLQTAQSRQRLILRFISFLKPKDLAVLRGEAVHHLGLLLFHVDDLFPLGIFVGRRSADEG